MLQIIKRLCLILAFLFSTIPAYAATSVRATSTASGASGSLSIAAPAGTATGDVVIVFCAVNGSTTNDIVDANGATPFTRDLETFETTNNTYLAVFSRRIQGGDPATYMFTNNPNLRWSCVAYAFQNPHASVIYDVSPTAGTPVTSGTTINAPTITTQTAAAIHVAVAQPDLDSNASTGTPATYTAVVNNTGQAIATAYKIIVSASATGAQTFTYTTSASATSVSLAIRDETAPAPSGSKRLMWMGFGR